MLSGLAAIASGVPSPNVAVGKVAATGGTVFVFPGQGSQWTGMAVDLLDSAPAFADQMLRCDAALAEFVEWSLIDVVRGGTGYPIDRVDVLQSVSLVSPVHQTRGQIAHRLDGRYGSMDPGELASLVRELAAAIDMSEVDYVLGFPEGGVIPAFAFAQTVSRPLIVSTRLELALPGAVSFEEPHSGLGTTHYIHGLREGDRVVIIEDEVTTGRTVINAVRALRQSGVHVDQVGALLAVDEPGMWESLREEKISLHVRVRLPG